MYKISIDRLMMLVDPVIIDIRSSYSYNMGHINGARNVPYYNLLNNFSHYLNKYDRYYLYCDTGEQSMEIVNRLNSFGYDTVNIIGGYQEYLRYTMGR